MSDREAKHYADLIMGSYLWAGSPATIFVTKRTTQEARRDKIKTKEYCQRITVQRLATAQARLKDLEMVIQKCQERAANPVGRGRGMIRRADKYLAQQHGKEPERIPGTVPVLPAFPDRAATLDDYHSARDPSESEYDTEETDPKEDRDDVEEDDDDVSVGSDTTFKSSGHDMDRTNRTTTSNRIQRHNQRKCKESQGWRPTNARKEKERRKGKVILSLFWDSPKEGALTYTDWRHKVEEYIQKGYDDNRIKDAMLSSVEGQAYVNFRSCNEGRNRTLAQILKEIDSIFNVSVTFWDLNARMCGLKQGMKEPIKTYYERMADISAKLEQYLGDRFGPGELKVMKKDCFYAGLKEHNKYLVSHMKDREQYGPTQMLKEIQEQEDSHYLANTSPKPHHTDSGNKNTSHYNKNLTYDKPWVYTVRHYDVQIPDQGGDEPDPSPTNEINPDEIYDEGYYMAVINTANKAHKLGRCFNWGKEGQRWAECKEPLKESLKLAKQRANHKKQALNQDGGVRTKGAQPPPDGYGQGQYGQGRKLAGPQLTPSAFWNEDPRNRWLSSANLGTAVIDGVETTCLIDNEARVNLVTPEFVRERGLDVGSIQDLSGHNGCIPLSGLGGKIREPLGYVMFRVQIPHVPSYDAKVALVVIEDSHFLKDARSCWEHRQ